MKQPDRLRIAWNYEPSTPVCCQCSGFRKSTMDMKSRKMLPPQCKKGGFDVRPNGCCDKWSSRTGERLL
jgi:hypothetical protein